MMIRTFHHSTLGLALNCWRLCNINKQRFESRKTHAYHTRHVVSKCNWEGGSNRACYREVSTRSVCTGHLYLAVSAPGAADTARRPTGPSAPSGGDSGEGPHLRAYSCSAAPPPNSSESRRAAVAPPATTYLRAPLSAPLSALLLSDCRLARPASLNSVQPLMYKFELLPLYFLIYKICSFESRKMNVLFLITSWNYLYGYLRLDLFFFVIIVLFLRLLMKFPN